MSYEPFQPVGESAQHPAAGRECVKFKGRRPDQRPAPNSVGKKLASGMVVFVERRTKASAGLLVADAAQTVASLVSKVPISSQ